MTSVAPIERSAAAIVAEGLRKSFARGPAVLQDVTLAIKPGEFVAIVGPSGCGKSTLLRLFAGLDSPDGGSLHVTHAGPSSGRTAFVFQEPALLPWRTVHANIALPLEIDGVSRRERDVLVGESLDLIGLSDQDAKKYPRQLSGGMRMRVSLARALVTKPGLLLLDEPFGALDDILRQRLNEDLHRLWREGGWTAVFVTHNVAEAAFLAERVLVMSANPGQVAGEVVVPFPVPRDPELRAQAEFARLAGEISKALRLHS